MSNGYHRIHAGSMDQCMAEIHRLNELRHIAQLWPAVELDEDFFARVDTAILALKQADGYVQCKDLCALVQMQVERPDELARAMGLI